MHEGEHAVDNDAISTGEDESNGYKNQEDEWPVETDSFQPDVHTIFRALFNTTQERRTNIPPIGIRVDIVHMTEAETFLEKSGGTKLFNADLTAVLHILGQQIFLGCVFCRQNTLHNLLHLLPTALFGILFVFLSWIEYCVKKYQALYYDGFHYWWQSSGYDPVAALSFIAWRTTKYYW